MAVDDFKFYLEVLQGLILEVEHSLVKLNMPGDRILLLDRGQ